jgi:hypothetical protein
MSRNKSGDGQSKSSLQEFPARRIEFHEALLSRNGLKSNSPAKKLKDAYTADAPEIAE